jgi:putative copper export protein
VVASGAWLGTVGVVAALALWRSSCVTVVDETVRTVLTRFSPVALTAAATVLVSGTIAGVVYVGTIDALVTSGYGRLLVVKLGIVALIAACGWRNWQRVRRRQPPERAVVAMEWAGALAAVVLTAVLSETEHP